MTKCHLSFRVSHLYYVSLIAIHSDELGLELSEHEEVIDVRIVRQLHDSTIS